MRHNLKNWLFITFAYSIEFLHFFRSTGQSQFLVLCLGRLLFGQRMYQSNLRRQRIWVLQLALSKQKALGKSRLLPLCQWLPPTLMLPSPPRPLSRAPQHHTQVRPFAYAHGDRMGK